MPHTPMGGGQGRASLLAYSFGTRTKTAGRAAGGIGLDCWASDRNGVRQRPRESSFQRRFLLGGREGMRNCFTSGYESEVRRTRQV